MRRHGATINQKIIEIRQSSELLGEKRNPGIPEKREVKRGDSLAKFLMKKNFDQACGVALVS
jgi:hypothetical protein